jgi:hypothetical protein
VRSEGSRVYIGNHSYSRAEFVRKAQEYVDFVDGLSELIRPYDDTVTMTYALGLVVELKKLFREGAP